VVSPGFVRNSYTPGKYKHISVSKIILKKKPNLDLLMNTGTGCSFGILVTAAFLFNNKKKKKTTHKMVLKNDPQLFLQKAYFVLYTERAVVLFKNSFNRTARHQGMILKGSSRKQVRAYGLLSCNSSTLLLAKETVPF